jgi:hypothetical protein
MGLQQLGDDRQPHPRPTALAVQQHHRRAIATLQHRGGHPGQVQPPFRDGRSGQHLPSSVVAGRATAAVLHDLLPAHADPSLSDADSFTVIVGDGARPA